MQVTREMMFAIIGELYVENRLLREFAQGVEPSDSEQSAVAGETA